MKTRLLVFVTVLAAGILVAYLLLTRKSGPDTIEGLIPATSVGVLSIDNVSEFYEGQTGHPWWDEFSTLPLFSRGQRVLRLLDSLNIKTDLSQLPVHVSFHITANDQLEPLFFVRSNDFTWQVESLRSLLQQVHGADGVTISERIYLDRTLYDVATETVSFSFFLRGEYLVISESALLVEDVIRVIEQNTSLLAGQDYGLGGSNSGVSLLLDYGKLNDLKAVFSRNSGSFEGAVGLFIQMDVETGPVGISFEGRSILKDNLINMKRADLDLKNFVPTSASSAEWSGLSQNITQVTDLGGFDAQAYYNIHQGDLCLVQMDLNDPSPGLVALASLSNPDLGETMLSDLATSLMTEGDTLFRESFMQTEITFINEPRLPELLYGQDFTGFDQAYYTIFNNVLLFGNNVDAIKAVLSEYDAENTWGRSIERRRYIDNLVQEAERTNIYNFEFLLERIKSGLKERWKTFFDEKAELVNALDLMSLQVSNTGAGLLINVALDFNESAQLDTRRADTADQSAPDLPLLEVRTNVFADTSLTTPAFVVRNHNTGAREIIFQDLSGQLYLTSDQGVILWKKNLEALVKGGISQIDYYNNRKLQYLFFTDSAMHLVDRNGNDVEGFPKPLETELPLEDHRVIDYDNTRRYRYAGADRRGNVFLYNKEGQLLEGWNPRPMGSQLLAVPEHVRIRGRDCFLMVEAEGTVHLTNRRGEYYPGFPYQANKRLAGDPVIIKGADFSRSTIMLASDNGELIGLSFEGRTLSRNQLLRPSARSRFYMVRDRLNTGFAVVRKDARQVGFFDQKGKELFTAPVAADDEVEFGFYNFRNDSEVFVLQNVTRGEVEIFDKTGRSLTGRSIAADARIGIIYYQSRAEYELFVNFANQMAVFSVRK